MKKFSSIIGQENNLKKKLSIGRISIETSLNMKIEMVKEAELKGKFGIKASMNVKTEIIRNEIIYANMNIKNGTNIEVG